MQVKTVAGADVDIRCGACKGVEDSMAGPDETLGSPWPPVPIRPWM
jgi:hypothetical protein